jgi:hypothetical protein
MRFPLAVTVTHLKIHAAHHQKRGKIAATPPLDHTGKMPQAPAITRRGHALQRIIS